MYKNLIFKHILRTSIYC